MKTREELLANTWKPDEDVNIGSYVIRQGKLGKILNAPTEKQLDCPYCHKGEHVYICENTYLEITPGETRVCKKRVIDYEEWQIGAVKFDYCPMCGRKLGDE